MPMEKRTQHFLGLEMQVAEFVIEEKMDPKWAYELLELLRSNQLVAILRHGEANCQCQDQTPPGQHDHVAN